MKNNDQSFTAEFKAGTYFIGDPCYALRDDLYEKWGKDNNYDDGNYDYFAVGSTANGDGTYQDIYSNTEFGVDAGILGVVNMQFANADANKNDILNKLGKIVTVKDRLIFKYDAEAFIFYYEYDDKLIQIPTVENDEDEEYDGEWW